MTDGSERHVRALLGSPALVPLIDRVVQRMRRGRPLTGQVVLPVVGPAGQAAIAALVGRPIGTGSSASVRLDEVDRIVRDSGAAPDLATAVVLLRGPITVTAAADARDRAAWDAAFAPLEAFARAHPRYAMLPGRLRRTGALKAAGRGPEESGRLLADVVAVLAALPTNGETLAAFSARVLHSAHALDVGMLRGLVEVALGSAAGALRDDTADAESSREERFVEHWAAVGIVFDSLASSVLVHALPFGDDEPVGRALNGLVATGQPVLVTLRMLVDGARPAAAEVFVCENPAVLIAAADRFGTACAPIVCVRGQPSEAAQRLLRMLASSGAALRYHGDFDWGGVRIANRMVERYGAVPWRYTSDDLRAADLPGDDLAGSRVEAVWDDELADEIALRGHRLEEEQVLASLLPDLAR